MTDTEYLAAINGQLFILAVIAIVILVTILVVFLIKRKK